MKKMDLKRYITFGIGLSIFIVSSEEVWSMSSEELSQGRGVQKASSFDLDKATTDERFEHYFGLINTEIEAHPQDSKTLVSLYRQALDLAVQYGRDGSQAALKQTPILQSGLAFKLHALTEGLPLLNRIESLRESCLLLRASCDGEDSHAKKNYGMALLEKSMFVDHVWTGGCSQDVFFSNTALMYLTSDVVL